MMEETKRELTFLSYAHDDLERVRKVYKGLKERKVSAWFDKADMGPGKWKPQIEKGPARFASVFFRNAGLRDHETD